jgi:GrpB-like predicted nucleotidyltransferase (UPF0157 family)
MHITTEKRIKHKNTVEKLRKEIGEISVENRKLMGAMDDKMERTGDFDGYRTIAISFNYLRICERYLEINQSSIENLNKRSDNDLKEARSNYSNSIRELERWTRQIPDYLTEKDQYMEKIKKFNHVRLLELMKTYLDNIERLYEGFKKTRWWGNIVSLEGQALNAFLYLVDFKEISNPHYMKAFYDQKIQIRMRLLEWLKKVSNLFREKYMLQTRETGDTDIKLAIKFQDHLRRICAVIGEPDEVEQARKTIAVWKSMKEKDALEREKKMNRRS